MTNNSPWEEKCLNQICKLSDSTSYVFRSSTPWREISDSTYQGELSNLSISLKPQLSDDCILTNIRVAGRGLAEDPCCDDIMPGDDLAYHLTNADYFALNKDILNDPCIADKLNGEETTTLETTITKELYDRTFVSPEGLVDIYKYTISNGVISIEVLDYGCTIIAINVPDSNGIVENICVRYTDTSDYFSRFNLSLGGFVGRVANIISGANFVIGNTIHFTSKNLGGHTYHGGVKNFAQRMWNAKEIKDGLNMTLKSLDLDQGFPGDVDVEVTMTLTDQNEFFILAHANTKKPTPIDLKSNVFFNLAGSIAGEEGLLQHDITVAADQFIQLDFEGVPTGKVMKVCGTPYNMTSPTLLKNVIQSSCAWEVNFVNKKPVKIDEQLPVVARLCHRLSGRVVELLTDQKSVQVSTGAQVKPAVMKSGNTQQINMGLHIGGQNYPDALKWQCFPNCIITPKDTYIHRCCYKFSVLEKPDELMMPLIVAPCEEGDEISYGIIKAEATAPPAAECKLRGPFSEYCDSVFDMVATRNENSSLTSKRGSKQESKQENVPAEESKREKNASKQSMPQELTDRSTATENSPVKASQVLCPSDESISASKPCVPANNLTKQE